MRNKYSISEAEINWDIEAKYHSERRDVYSRVLQLMATGSLEAVVRAARAGYHAAHQGYLAEYEKTARQRRQKPLGWDWGCHDAIL